MRREGCWIRPGCPGEEKHSRVSKQLYNETFARRHIPSKGVEMLEKNAFSFLRPIAIEDPASSSNVCLLVVLRHLPAYYLASRIDAKNGTRRSTCASVEIIPHKIHNCLLHHGIWLISFPSRVTHEMKETNPPFLRRMFKTCAVATSY